MGYRSRIKWEDTQQPNYPPAAQKHTHKYWIMISLHSNICIISSLVTENNGCRRGWKHYTIPKCLDADVRTYQAWLDTDFPVSSDASGNLLWLGAVPTFALSQPREMQLRSPLFFKFSFKKSLTHESFAKIFLEPEKQMWWLPKSNNESSFQPMSPAVHREPEIEYNSN